MVLRFMDFAHLMHISIFAVGLAYVVTGSVIGYPVRVVGRVLTKWCPLPLSTLFFCPSCNAWWCGLGLGIWAGLPWQNIIQCAFSSCLLGVIAQQQWGLAADDMEDIDKQFFQEESDE